MVAKLVKMSLALGCILVSAGLVHAAKPETPKSLDGVKSISVEDVAAMVKSKKVGVDFIVIDSRKSSDFEAGRVPGATNIAVGGRPNLGEKELAKGMEALKGKLPQNKKQLVIFYCNGITCWRSPKASTCAVKMGYTNVLWMRDGFNAWKKAGLPVE